MEDVRLATASQRLDGRLKVTEVGVHHRPECRDGAWWWGAAARDQRADDHRREQGGNHPDRGEVNGIGLEDGKISIVPVIGGSRRAVAELNLAGDMGNGIAVAKAMRMIKRRGTGDATTLQASGQAIFGITAAFPVRPRRHLTRLILLPRRV